MLPTIASVFLPILTLLTPADATPNTIYGAPANNYSCTSSIHPNPVVLLHALGANANVGLDRLQHHLNDAGFCTFSLTYGASPLFSWVGGVAPLARSAVEIGAFIESIPTATGRVDIVGHSEGAVQAVHVPRTQSRVRGRIEHVVALAPAIHGAEYFGFTDLWYVGGSTTRELFDTALKVIECAACTDLAVGGDTTEELNNGQPIVQDGNKVTIIASSSDKLVPPEKSVVDEQGVRNILLQDVCPESRAGHMDLAYDLGVWGLIVNALTEEYDGMVQC